MAASFLFIIAVLMAPGGLARSPRLRLVEAFGGDKGYSLVATLSAHLISRTCWYQTAVFLFSISFGTNACREITLAGGAVDFGLHLFILVQQKWIKPGERVVLLNPARGMESLDMP